MFEAQPAYMWYILCLTCTVSYNFTLYMYICIRLVRFPDNGPLRAETYQF